MFYCFPNAPSIIDHTSISQLPDQSRLNNEERELLKKVDQCRAVFKSQLTQDYMNQLKNGIIQILQSQQSLENYLKTNVDVMRILVIKSNYHPCFKYGLFLSNIEKEFSTEKNSINNYLHQLGIEEACGCEIVMVRYIYALAFNLNTYAIVQRIKQQLFINFHTSQPLSLQQQSSDINSALVLMEFAQVPLHRLCNCMEDLLKSLITHQNQLIPELRMTVIASFKNIIDSNANFIYIEKLRMLKDFEMMAKVCRASYSKLNESFQRLSQIDGSVKQDVIEFCNKGMLYYKIYGIWCILQLNEKCIKYENYKQKNYIILTSENFKIANFLKDLSTEMEKQTLRDEFQEFTLNFLQNCLLPTLDKILNLYGKGANQNVKNPDELFMCLESSNDYYEDKQKQII